MARKSPARRRLDRWVYYPLQAVLMYLLYGLFAVLPVDAASALGGWIGRTVGPLLATPNRRALHNLSLAMPTLPEVEKRRILRGMWDNLGRSIAEYPHLRRLREPDRLDVVGTENVTGAAVAGRPRILMAAHLGNWEMGGAWAAVHISPLSSIYRPPNNPAVDWLIRRVRAATGMAMYPKGNDGTRAAMKVLSQSGSLGMLIDQKLNRGIAVPFFGHDAMTAPALAVFTLRFDCAVVPARVERLGGARFRLTFYPPLDCPRTGDRDTDVLAMMTRVNGIIEGWVRERPEQWFWMHRRWIDSIK